MTESRKKPLQTVHRLDEIPAFASEADEHAFWASHELSDALWDASEPLAPGELPPSRPATVAVIVRLDEATLQRVKALARRRRKGYRTLLGEFVAERLDEEERRAQRPRARRSSTG